jgi:hypothetical protein
LEANQPIRRSVEKITAADFILEIEPKRTSSEKNFTTAKFWRTTTRTPDLERETPVAESKGRYPA